MDQKTGEAVKKIDSEVRIVAQREVEKALTDSGVNKNTHQLLKKARYELTKLKMQLAVKNVKQEPREEPEVVTLSDCCLCDETFDSEAALEDHVSSAHSSIFK